MKHEVQIVGIVKVPLDRRKEVSAAKLHHSDLLVHGTRHPISCSELPLFTSAEHTHTQPLLSSLLGMARAAPKKDDTL